MNDGVCLCVDVDPERLQRRVDHRYLDEWTRDLDDALARVLGAKRERRALSVGLLGNAATVFAELLARGVAVSYTHLDVYKRQLLGVGILALVAFWVGERQ